MKHLSWQTLEYIYKERSSDWYWTLGIIAAAAAITSAIFGNLLFAAVIAIGAFALAMHSAKRPGMLHVEIRRHGIAINSDMYLYRSIHSFSIDDNHRDGPRLLIRSQKVFAPVIILGMGDVDVEELREELKKHVKEEPHEETFAGHLIDRLGL
jgi:hypothetical protein